MKSFIACVTLLWLESANSAVIYIGKAETVNYETATQRCSSLTFSGQLATWSSQAQYDSLCSAKTALDSSWVGLNDVNQEGKWQMVDGDASYCDDFDGTDCDNIPQWSPDEPNDYGTGEDCAEIRSGGSFDNLLNDIPCTYTRHYVCEINVDNVAIVGDVNVEPLAVPNNNYYNYSLEVTSTKDIVVLASVLLNVVLFVCVCYVTVAAKASKNQSAYSKVSMDAADDADEKL